MAEDKQKVEIDIETKSNSRGADETKRSIDGIKGSVDGVGRSMEMLGKITRGLGIIMIFQQAVAALQGLHAWLNRSATEAENLAQKTREAADTKAVDAAIAKYAELRDTLASVNKELARKSEIEALTKGGQRGMEDARSALAEIGEVSALDLNDPERAQKEAVIRARYGRQRAIAAASRKREDAVIGRQVLSAEADQKSGAADNMEAAMPGMKAQLAALRNQASVEESRAKAALRRNLMSGAQEDTPESRERGALAGRYTSQADKLEASLQAMTKQIEGLRQDASFNRQKAGAMFSTYQSAGVELETADKGGTAAITMARKAQTDATYKRTSEAAKLAADIEAKEQRARQLRQEAEGAVEEQAGFRQTVFDEERDVYNANKRLSSVPKNRRRGREYEGLQAEAEQQQAELRGANTQFATALRDLGKVVKDSIDEAKKLEAEVKQLRARQKTSRADAGNID